MSQKCKVYFGRSKKEVDLIETPIKHIRVACSKQIIHGWAIPYSDRGRRECSAERILLNPYNGCKIECPMCYARALKGYFQLWDEGHIITVFDKFDEKVADELDTLHIASCGYLSPITDPFQKPLENTYHLTEKTINVFIDRGLPIEFITKQGNNIPCRVLDKMATQPHSFCQFTILSSDAQINRIFASGGATPEEQFKAIRKAVDRGLYVVVRVDPMFPGITDDDQSFRDLVTRAKEEGANHIVASLCDIDRDHRRKLLKYVEKHFPDQYLLWRKIYCEWIGNDLNPTIDYRRKIFNMCKTICDENSLTFSLCMEFEKINNGYRGLNEDYMTSKVCEGKIVPMYFRKHLDDPFKPIAGCDGNCLAVSKTAGQCGLACGFPKLGRADALKYKDYVLLHPAQRTLF